MFLRDLGGQKQLRKTQIQFFCILGGNELVCFEAFPQGSDFRDESLAEDSCLFSCACTRCPNRSCGLCEDPAVLLAGRGSFQGHRMAVPSALTTGRPSCLWQVTMLGQSQGCVMLLWSFPILSQGCVRSGLSWCVQEQFALPGLPIPCLAMTPNTLSLSVEDHMDTKCYPPL